MASRFLVSTPIPGEEKGGGGGEDEEERKKRKRTVGV